MKILFISQYVGITAPGIVCERILDGLSKKCDVDLITCFYKPSKDLDLIKKKQVVRYPSIHYRLRKYLFRIFGTDVVSQVLKYKTRNVSNDYDVILSIGASEQFFGLVIGRFIKKKCGFKWACYMVDAIPAPLGWSHDNMFYRMVLKMIKKTLADADMISSLNQQMLDYQTSLFDNRNLKIKDVLFPPAKSISINYFERKNENSFRFLYTGNIYGQRSSKYILEAFNMLVANNENAEILFVGSNLNDVLIEKKKYNKHVQDRILVAPPTNDLKPYYESCFALIDIDADIEHDVFLSSKMSEYMTCNRPIICETGADSPSRHLFCNIPSILQCGHSPMELKEAMSYVIRHYEEFDYDDRKRILHEFSTSNIVQKMIIDFTSLQ